jgi:hypothetical protein
VGGVANKKKTNPGFWKILLLCHIPSTPVGMLSDQMGKKLSETPNCTCQLEFGTQYSIQPT